MYPSILYMWCHSNTVDSFCLWILQTCSLFQTCAVDFFFFWGGGYRLEEVVMLSWLFFVVGCFFVFSGGGGVFSFFNGKGGNLYIVLTTQVLTADYC